MATTIKLKNSTVTTTTPSTLAQGEVAINITDKKVWVGNAATTPVQIVGSGTTGTAAGSTGYVQFNNSGALGASANLFWDNSNSRLGIGLTTPATYLQIDGANISGRGQLSLNGGSGGISQLSLYNGNTTITNLTGQLYSNGDNIGVMLSAYQATGYLAFQTNANTERMRIDSSGNVGIGTNTPSTYGNLVVYDNSGNSSATLSLGNTNSGASTVCGSIKYFRNTAEVASIVYDAANAVLLYNAWDATYGKMIFRTANVTRMSITETGGVNVGSNATNSNPVGNRVNGFAIRANGSMGARQPQSTSDWGVDSTSGSICNFYSDNGSIYVYAGSISVNSNTTAYTSVSDYRLKKDISPLTGGLDRVMKLNPVTYTFKNNEQKSEGFIAHELQKVVPDAVTGEKDAVKMQEYEISPAIPAKLDAEGNEIEPAVEAIMGQREVPDYQGVDTSFLIATLTSAIQELNAKVTALEQQVISLSVK